MGADRIRGASEDRVAFNQGAGAGGGATEDLEATLTEGNTSGANDIVVEAGQKVDLGGTPGDPDGSLAGVVGALGRGVSVRDSGADEGCLMYASQSMYAFATGTNQGERSGMALEFSGTQVGFFYNLARIFFITAAGIDLQSRSLANNRINVSNHTSDSTIAAQATGSILTNIGAAGLVTLTLPASTAVLPGARFKFYRVEAFDFRIQPDGVAANAIILSSGKLPDNNYIRLAASGSSVELVLNSQGDWMAVYQNGTILPE